MLSQYRNPVRGAALRVEGDRSSAQFRPTTDVLARRNPHPYRQMITASDDHDQQGHQ
jgi:hypothetical protein